MHALLITGGNKELRAHRIADVVKEWKTSSFDQITIASEGKGIGIAQIRNFQQRLLLKPYDSPVTTGIIQDAHLLTTEAQNALLKTLEEPPPHARIVLESETQSNLLPTILSRCTIEILPFFQTVSTDQIQRTMDTFATFKQGTTGKRLAMIDEMITTRDTAIQWVEESLTVLRYVLLQSYQASTDPSSPFTFSSRELRHLISSLLRAQTYLSSNITPKLACDSIVLQL